MFQSLNRLVQNNQIQIMVLFCDYGGCSSGISAKGLIKTHELLHQPYSDILL